jgi:hypothetical protein
MFDHVSPRPAGAVLLLVVAASALGACGGGSGGTPGAGPSPAPFVGGGETRPPKVIVKSKSPDSLGFPAFATKNTTRVGGSDPVTDAAGVALSVFPGQSVDTRPPAVALADQGDWRAATAAAALMAAPVRAPLLLTDGNTIPDATAAALTALKPTGSHDASSSQVIAVGSAPPEPKRLKTDRIAGGDPFSLAAAVDRFLAAAKGKPSDAVVVVAADQPKYGIPAAAWAAKSGDPVLFVAHDEVPAATQAALKTHAHPRIFVLGPKVAVSDKALGALKKLGTVTRISGSDPVSNAIAFARYQSGSFGWGVTDPGHGLTIANDRRPLDGPASAALSSSGDYGPLLLTDQPDRVPPALEGYLLDIQPGYRSDPVRGVYNHAWLIGDRSAISVAAQARIDQLLEILPVDAHTP